MATLSIERETHFVSDEDADDRFAFIGNSTRLFLVFDSDIFDGTGTLTTINRIFLDVSLAPTFPAFDGRTKAWNEPVPRNCDTDVGFHHVRRPPPIYFSQVLGGIFPPDFSTIDFFLLIFTKYQ